MGEPTDAQVEAAGRAILPLLDPTWPYSDYEEIERWVPEAREEFNNAIRATLRAALASSPGVDADGWTRPYAHVQYKGTNICMDFQCICGIEDDGLGHFDGYHAYAIKCTNCGRLYEMPTVIDLVPIEATDFTPIEINGNDKDGMS